MFASDFVIGDAECCRLPVLLQAASGGLYLPNLPSTVQFQCQSLEASLAVSTHLLCEESFAVPGRLSTPSFVRILTLAIQGWGLLGASRHGQPFWLPELALYICCMGNISAAHHLWSTGIFLVFLLCMVVSKHLSTGMHFTLPAFGNHAKPFCLVVIVIRFHQMHSWCFLQDGKLRFDQQMLDTNFVHRRWSHSF